VDDKTLIFRDIYFVPVYDKTVVVRIQLHDASYFDTSMIAASREQPLGGALV
jgi:hypothetical protein